MLEFMSAPGEGIPELGVEARTCLLQSVPVVVYMPALTVQAVGMDGSLVLEDVFRDRSLSAGWVPSSDFTGWAEPSPGWDAALAQERFTLTQPDGLSWYDGTLPATAQWLQAARAAGIVFHFTGSRGDAPQIIERIGTSETLAVASRFGEAVSEAG
ncbi:hypothetical protein [Streptomyces clavuligerus]|uniref:hypothetical protein n=1 Tax=Streptomyces clavuligerus TaxID=1901 RepID=UPI00020D9479|nr:hypothetical protein [Streptomyces clavuligerus]WDN56137.1 hypothetical protein LL058_30220 [Streptomyces clavuligerus]